MKSLKFLHAFLCFFVCFFSSYSSSFPIKMHATDAKIQKIEPDTKQVGRGQVCLVSAKVSAIVDFPVPTTRGELCQILGKAGYYRSFC